MLLVGRAVLNFKIVCNSIHELLNVFEDPAQRVHTIVLQTLLTSVLVMPASLTDHFCG